MDNYRIASTDRILEPGVRFDDGSTVAVHVLTGVPLTAATSKIAVAKLGGLFRGKLDYYEAQAITPRPQRRYVA